MNTSMAKLGSILKHNLVAMHQEKYSLTWQTYSDHLRSMMKELMMNEDYSDVTLVTEDKKQIKANINILSACSPVFQDLLKKENGSNQIVYLRGIKFPEMETIMQFIYLGEATFYEERMEEFIAVAKSLEIKELCTADTETNVTPNDEPLPSDQVSGTEILEEQNLTSDCMTNQASQHEKGSIFTINRKFACDQCEYEATRQKHLTLHIQALHEGVKYACDQCDFKGTTQGSLKRHVQSMHDGVKFACGQCDFQATRQDSLRRHIKVKHLA